MSAILTSRIVNVQFTEGDARVYAYYTADETLKAGDLAVVVSPNSRSGEFPVFGEPKAGSDIPSVLGHAKIVRVVSTEETVEGIEKVREWIVSKVDFGSYAERRVVEEKRKILLAKVKRARADALAAFELTELAEKSPALKSLLGELEKLG